VRLGVNFATPSAVSRFSPYQALITRAPAPVPPRPAPPQMIPSPCPYPVTAAQRAFADGLFASAVRNSWLNGSQYSYLNSIYVPARVGSTLQLANATYLQILASPDFAGNPSVYLGQWIVGGTCDDYGGPRWMSFPVQPGVDPYSGPGIRPVQSFWQRFAATESGPYTPTVGGDLHGAPTGVGCGTWSH
jgi:hypothetical protein